MTLQCEAMVYRELGVGPSTALIIGSECPNNAAYLVDCRVNPDVDKRLRETHLEEVRESGEECDCPVCANTGIPYEPSGYWCEEHTWQYAKHPAYQTVVTPIQYMPPRPVTEVTGDDYVVEDMTIDEFVMAMADPNQVAEIVEAMREGTITMCAGCSFQHGKVMFHRIKQSKKR